MVNDSEFGYRPKQEVQFMEVRPEDPVHMLAGEDSVSRQVSVLLEVERGRALPVRLRRRPRHHDLGSTARRQARLAELTAVPVVAVSVIDSYQPAAVARLAFTIHETRSPA